MAKKPMAEVPPVAPEIVRMRGVSKRFIVRQDNSLKERLVTLGRVGRRHRSDFWALRDIDLTIHAGTTVGLIGHNGSGKSTLLKVLGGIIDPTNGSAERRGRIAALLELGTGFHPDLTGRENVFLNAAILGLTRAETEARLDDILSFASIGDHIDTQVKFYSSGMFVRLAFAVAVHTDPDLLLVDEVLAVGDEAFQRKCMDKIRTFQQEGRTIVLVSHSLDQVVDLCDRTVLLNAGEIVFDGDPREAVREFRGILETRRKAEVQASGGAAVPQHAQWVDSALATPSAPGADGELMAGTDLDIEFDLHCDAPKAGMILAIGIDSSRGQVAYSTTTRLLGVDLEPFTGTRRVRFRLEDCQFGPGKYFVHISVIDEIGVHLYDWPQAISFDMHDYRTSFGTVHIEPRFEIVDG